MIANNRFDEQNHLAVGVSTHSVKGVVRTGLPLETGKIGLEMPLQLRQASGFLNASRKILLRRFMYCSYSFMGAVFMSFVKPAGPGHYSC